MLTLKEWMELVDYKITEGSDLYTNIPGLYGLSSWNGEQDGFSFYIAFDPKNNQRVYYVEACDYARNRAYRLKDPDVELDKQAWDDVDFTELEEDDDFIQKCLAIKEGEEYDTRVSVPLNIPDDALFELMKRAHDQDITLNQLVEQVLWEAISAEEAKQQSEDDLWDDLADDAHWDDDSEVHFTNTDNPVDFPFPAPAMKKAKKKKK